MEPAGIAAGLVLAAGALVALVLHVWVVRHPGRPGMSCAGRPVATAPGHGFPSGHAAAAAAVCGALAWLCSLRIGHGRAGIAVWAGGAILAALVGLSRVYLGVYWMSDVIGGWLFGILWLAVVVRGWPPSAKPREPQASRSPKSGRPGRWPPPLSPRAASPPPPAPAAATGVIGGMPGPFPAWPYVVSRSRVASTRL